VYRLLLLAIFLLPFNALPIYVFGSLSSEGAFYPLLIMVTLTIIKVLNRGKFQTLDKTLYKLTVLLCAFSIIVAIYNIGTIISASYMGRVGVTRFVEQFFQLILGFLIVYSVALAIDTEYKLYRLIKFISLVMAGFIAFGFFQLLAYKTGGVLLQLHDAIGKVIFHEGISELMQRRGGIHSVSQEPSLLSMYFAVMGPYVLVFSIKTKRYHIAILMAVLLVFSFSRTGYVIFFLLFTLILILFNFKYLNLSKFVFSIPLVVAILGLLAITPALDVFLSLMDTEESGSNAARYAASFAAILLWLDNNIWLGIGLGQTGFHSVEYLPAWGFISGEIQDISNGERWPFIHNLLVKLLVENGIVGLGLWFMIYMTFLKKINHINKLNGMLRKKDSWVGYGVFASVVGSFLIMFNRELLSNMNIWISLGIALAYIRLQSDKLANKEHFLVE